VLYVGGTPWTGAFGVPFLVGWNLRIFPAVPWSALVMALYLWLFWRYLRGAGWPSATSESRRAGLRANSLSSDVWSVALVAGLVGLAATLPLARIMSRLVRLPDEAQPIATPPDMPFITVFVLLIMGSVVAGVVEEAAFRGYMQRAIERRHGLLVAILVSGTIFGLLHYTHHPAAVFPMLPYYLAVSAVYGGLAFATDSILPGLVLHAGGDVFSLTRLWTTGQPAWQVTTTPPPLVWESGLDSSFVIALVLFGLLCAASGWAYIATWRAARQA